MTEEATWGAILLGSTLLWSGALHYRWSKDRNFRIDWFDGVCVALNCVLLWAAVQGWRPWPTVFWGGTGLLFAGVLRALSLSAVLRRVNTRFKRIALLFAPFPAIVAAFQLFHDAGYSPWQPSLLFFLALAATLLSLFVALTPLGDWASRTD